VSDPDSIRELELFRQKVLETPGLLKQLRAAADEEHFIGLMVQLGAEHGLHFSGEEVLEAIRSSRRSWLERWL
jgi:hypothetical protein